MSDQSPFAGNPFNRLNSRDRDVYQHEQGCRWEDARVVATLKRLHLGQRMRALRQQAVELTGVEQLTFRVFNYVYPTFPMTLGCNRLSHLPKPLHLLQEAIFPAWLKNFRNLPIVEPFESFYESLGDERTVRPVGMIFPRNGFPQGLILHTGSPDQFVPPRSGYFCYHGGDKKHPLDLVVQPYSLFLDHIYSRGRGWTPDA